MDLLLGWLHLYISLVTLVTYLVNGQNLSTPSDSTTPANLTLKTKRNAWRSGPEMPFDLALKLNDGVDLSSVIENYDAFVNDHHSYSSYHEKSNAVVPRQAACKPEQQTIRLEGINPQPGLFYFPTCTRIDRCGGCCSHHLLSCQPIEAAIEVVNFEVNVMQYTGGDKLQYVGKEIIPVEKHTKCRCGCRVAPQDCNQFQEYSPADCRCVCRNYDEESKCNNFPSGIKLWDANDCICRCRDILDCSTGYFYDQNECQCKPLRQRYDDDN